MLTFYFKKNCPFCTKVLTELHEEIGADFEVRYKANDDNEKKTREVGGKVQFPLLVDEANDVVMYESDDIIAYLRKNYRR